MNKKTLIRIFLAILIVLNVYMIFGFSRESAEQSSQTSQKVTQDVANVIIKDFDKKTEEEQSSIISSMHPSIRTVAHITEFGTLGMLLMLFVHTWKLRPVYSALIAVGTVSLTATADELFQHFEKNGRAGEVKDVLFDTSGAIIGCAILLLIIYLARFISARNRKKPLQVTSCRVDCPKLDAPLKIAVAADLHDNPYQKALQAIRENTPDLILVPGDLTDDSHIADGGKDALEFLKACAEIAPTFYSLGNHEVSCYHRGNPFRHPIPKQIPKEFADSVAKTGAVLLDNSFVRFKNLTLFGLSSGIHGKENRPDPEVLQTFEKNKGEINILLSHHPEYYLPYLKDLGMDLTVSGHAHGGHWRFFGRGVYAPGQGLFPKYTSGVLDGKCVISRGLGDHTSIPRICNPRELVMVTLG